MKFKSLIFSSLCAIAAVVTGCSDNDNSYTPGADSDGAYFFSKATALELNINSTSFDLEVGRTSDQTGPVKVVAEDPSGLFTIPSEVNFAGDAVKSTLTIGYDPEKLEFGKSYELKLRLDPGTVYGNSDYTLTVSLPEPWVTIGKALYTDGIVNCCLSLEAFSMECEIQEYDGRPGYYRLVDPYKNYPPVAMYSNVDYMAKDPQYLYIHAEDPEKVWFEICNTYVAIETDGAWPTFIGCSRAKRNLDAGGSADGWWGTLKDGIITLPQTKGVILAGTSDSWSYPSGSYYTGGQTFRVALPGHYAIGYFSATVTYNGRYTNAADETFIIADVTLGEDVETARVACGLTNDIAALEQGIVDGSIEYQEISESGEVRFPVTDEGRYTIVVVTYAGGEAQESASTSVEISLGGAKWKEVGVCAIYDGFMLGASGNNPADYIWTVPVQENENEPGVYRLMSMYGTETPLGNFALGDGYNIVVNASDNNFIYIEPQFTGNAFFEDGAAYIANAAGLYLSRGNDKETIINAGIQMATRDGNEITFPAGTCMINFGGDKWYTSKSMAVLDFTFANGQSIGRKSVKSRKVANHKMSSGEIQARLHHPLIFKKGIEFKK